MARKDRNSWEVIEQEIRNDPQFVVLADEHKEFVLKFAKHIVMTKGRPDMAPEYDFRGARRGAYAKRYARGVRVTIH